MSPTVAADSRRRGTQTAASGTRPSREILHVVDRVRRLPSAFPNHVDVDGWWIARPTRESTSYDCAERLED